jgi:hypothetical protein
VPFRRPAKHGKPLRNNAVWICRAGRDGRQPCHSINIGADMGLCQPHGMGWDRMPVPSSYIDDFMRPLLDEKLDDFEAERRAMWELSRMTR